MKKSLTLISTCIVITLCWNAHLQAQGGVGVHVGRNFKLEETLLGLDARVGFNIGKLPFWLNPSFDYYFIDSYTLIGFELNMLYRFAPEKASSIPYIGAGIGMLYSAVPLDGFESSVGSFSGGPVLTGGYHFRAGGVFPGFEASALFIDKPSIRISGRLMFQL